ncbi:ankyrin repeat domain-containing protein [Rickettsiella endosymbiont of Dermanyssus gallinae]|uniref:ankyrin repeat domain-containing protein n=1 Tax=Rickettsiella endosymbiont of Dermanyssus gallinae TaxID=2856608 RepID=UPI001C52A9BA|nr:ankyrin repeat domain-containing protein [Rickettsiella endosymbiont of Dermanyssus gallinae]
MICPDSENGLATLSNLLKSLLAKDKQNYPVSTKIYSLGNDQKEVTQAFSSFCKKEKLINNEASAQEIGSFLQLAAMYGHIDVVNALLKDKLCDPNEKTNAGVIAPHLAAESGHIDVVNALLKDKLCNPNEKNDTGTTALDLAKIMDHEDVVKILKNHLRSIKNKHANSNPHSFFKPDSSNETKQTSLPLRSVENLAQR